MRALHTDEDLRPLVPDATAPDAAPAHPDPSAARGEAEAAWAALPIDADRKLASDIWPKMTPVPGRAPEAAALDGSWHVALVSGAGRWHGALRLEVVGAGVKLSMDLYRAEAWHDTTSASWAVFQPYWYPQLAPEHYDAHAASRNWWMGGGQGQDGLKLFASVDCNVWDAKRRDFGAPVQGGRLVAETDWATGTNPKPGLQTLLLHGCFEMPAGSALGGRHLLSACKTSPYYRGVDVVVAESAGTQWPDRADHPKEGALSFCGVFGTHGIHVRGRVEESDAQRHEFGDGRASEVGLVAQLAQAERQRQGDVWHMAILLASKGRVRGRPVLGVMRDFESPHREGAAVFFDAVVDQSLGGKPEVIASDLRGKRLGSSKLALLRTALHEAGHVLGLPHGREIARNGAFEPGRDLMDPAGDVIETAATAECPFPDCASFRFSPEMRALLIHGPDEQIAPRRGPFLWLPGFIHGGIAMPDQPAPPVA